MFKYLVCVLFCRPRKSTKNLCHTSTVNGWSMGMSNACCAQRKMFNRAQVGACSSFSFEIAFCRIQDYIKYVQQYFG